MILEAMTRLSLMAMPLLVFGFGLARKQHLQKEEKGWRQQHVSWLKRATPKKLELQEWYKEEKIRNFKASLPFGRH